MNKSLFISLFLISSICKLNAQMLGTLTEVSFVGSVTGETVNFSIYLPVNYTASDKAYSVIYHLHSLGDNYRSNACPLVINAFENSADLGFIDDAIIVFPDGYENSMWANSIDGTKPAETNIIDEVMPYVDAHYRTIPDREHRFVQGFSMGGFGAAKFMAKFPDKFSRATLFDGGMRTWNALVQGRHQIAQEIFNLNEEYFNQYAPWKYLRENRSVLSIDTLFFVFIGDFSSFNRTFFDSLNSQGIPFKFVKEPCGHDLKCILEREWISVAEYYSNSYKLSNDFSVNIFNGEKSIMDALPHFKKMSINFSNTKISKVNIDIINMMGTTVYQVLDAYADVGYHRLDVPIDESVLPRGTYVASYSASNNVKIQKIIVIK